MTQRKMLQIKAGALLLLLPWFGGLASGELSARFAKCQQFFYKRIPPQGFGNKYQAICQLYKGHYRFATLYDRQHRTALYSAYLISSSNESRDPKPTWMYEPQLVFGSNDPEMQSFPDSVNQRVKESQAVLEDYTNSDYTRGHLAPSQHLKTKEDREASFTLTNIVPQMKGSNSGPWSDLETKVLNRFKKDCKGKMYVITGTIPYESVRMLKNRVSIPESIWSAYCCPSYRHKLTNSSTFAAMGSNDPNKGYTVEEMTLNKLQRNLNRRLSIIVSLFDGNCSASEP